jgi:hypothetical protein
MSDFDGLLAFNALLAVLGAVVVIHRNQLRKPRPVAVKAKAPVRPAPGLSVPEPHDPDFITEGGRGM